MSTESIIIAAEPRNEFGKGASRRLRRAEKVPGVIYGASLETPIHFAVSRRELHALLRHHGSNAVFEIDIDGDKHLVMIKHVDQNVITLNADHVDLLAIKRGEKEFTEITMLKPTVAALKGLKMFDVLQMDVDALQVLLPRVTQPMLHKNDFIG